MAILKVDEVRTSDDALLKLKFMMFYELRDIEKMVCLFKTSEFYAYNKDDS